MAYSVLYVGHDNPKDTEGKYMEFVADTTADIASLPTTGPNGVNVQGPRPGSMAVCAENASLYMLSNAREWGVLVEG